MSGSISIISGPLDNAMRGVRKKYLLTPVVFENYFGILVLNGNVPLVVAGLVLNGNACLFLPTKGISSMGTPASSRPTFIALDCTILIGVPEGVGGANVATCVFAALRTPWP